MFRTTVAVVIAAASMSLLAGCAGGEAAPSSPDDSTEFGVVSEAPMTPELLEQLEKLDAADTDDENWYDSGEEDWQTVDEDTPYWSGADFSASAERLTTLEMVADTLKCTGLRAATTPDLGATRHLSCDLQDSKVDLFGFGNDASFRVWEKQLIAAGATDFDYIEAGHKFAVVPENPDVLSYVVVVLP